MAATATAMATPTPIRMIFVMPRNLASLSVRSVAQSVRRKRGASYIVRSALFSTSIL
jgi:hypothetical protein